jgi:hypothetical protein
LASFLFHTPRIGQTGSEWMFPEPDQKENRLHW